MGKQYYCLKLLLIFGVYFAMTSCQMGRIFTQPHPATKVDPREWNKLQIGMTKGQVISLLGEAPCQRKRTVTNGKENNLIKTEDEFWEYNVCSSALAGPDPRAYVIWFDTEGKVSSMREPTE